MCQFHDLLREYFAVEDGLSLLKHLQLGTSIHQVIR